MGQGAVPIFRFSPATPGDIDRLVELRVRAMRPALERIGRFDPDRARRRLTEQYRPHFTRLIWAGETFAGCVAFAPHGPDRRMLEHFYLEPAMSGRGIGSAVMAALMTEADAEGATVVLTVVRESDANRLYPRYGFVETGRDEVDIFYERPPGASGVEIVAIARARHGVRAHAAVSRQEAQMPATFRHFAINADDVPRAKGFYEAVFGWTFTPWGPPGFYQTRSAGQGFLGALQGRRELVPGQRTNALENSFGVEDLSATIAAIEAGGGRIVMPRVKIEGVGELVYFEDPEGNILGAMQYEPGLSWD